MARLVGRVGAVHGLTVAWGGYSGALASDPGGVASVLAIAPVLPQTADRGAASVPLDAEIAWAIERESGWNPAARNKTTDASGLIQFMPATARTLGTTVDALRSMSRAQQAAYVKRFFLMVLGKNKLDRVGDLLMAMFAPAFVGKPDDTVVFPVGSLAWKQNAPYRAENNGPITVASVRAKGSPPGDLPARPPPGAVPADPPKAPPGSRSKSGGWGLILAAIVLSTSFSRR